MKYLLLLTLTTYSLAASLPPCDKPGVPDDAICLISNDLVSSYMYTMLMYNTKGTKLIRKTGVSGLIVNESEAIQIIRSNYTDYGVAESGYTRTYTIKMLDAYETDIVEGEYLWSVVEEVSCLEACSVMSVKNKVELIESYE